MCLFLKIVEPFDRAESTRYIRVKKQNEVKSKGRNYSMVVAQRTTNARNHTDGREGDKSTSLTFILGFPSPQGATGVLILTPNSGSFHYPLAVWSLRILKEQNCWRKRPQKTVLCTSIPVGIQSPGTICKCLVHLPLSKIKRICQTVSSLSTNLWMMI